MKNLQVIPQNESLSLQDIPMLQISKAQRGRLLSCPSLPPC